MAVFECICVHLWTQLESFEVRPRLNFATQRGATRASGPSPCNPAISPLGVFSSALGDTL